MPWFKVDDGFYDNPKVKSISRRDRMACLGLWVTAGTWCAKHLTDGRVPVYMVEEFGADLSHGDALVAAGLWRRDSDDYVFHDWHDWQPTRVDTLASREKERRRKEAYRAKKAGNTGQSPAGTQTDGANASQDPDPTRPDPTNISTSAPAVLVTERDFEQAWQYWPKKTERKKSLEKFKTVARRRGVDVLTADIRRFGEAYASTTERQYVPALNVWLNGERWTDDLPSRSKASARNIPKNEEWMYR